MKAFGESCRRLGVEDDGVWLGYADDLVIESRSLDSANTALHLLQAAAAFVGLHVNAKKSECMSFGLGERKVEEKEAMKERVRIRSQPGNRKGMSEVEGMLVDWEGRNQLLELGILEQQQLDECDMSAFGDAGPTHLFIPLSIFRSSISFSESSASSSSSSSSSDFLPFLSTMCDSPRTVMAVRLSGLGWVMLENERKHRIKKMGVPDRLSGLLLGQIRCERCEEVFTENGLVQHHRYGRCQKVEEMIDEQ